MREVFTPPPTQIIYVDIEQSELEMEFEELLDMLQQAFEPTIDYEIKCISHNKVNIAIRDPTPVKIELVKDAFIETTASYELHLSQITQVLYHVFYTISDTVYKVIFVQ